MRHSRSGKLAAAVIFALTTVGLVFQPAAAWSGRTVPAGSMIRTGAGGAAQPGNPVTVQPPSAGGGPPGHAVVGTPRRPVPTYPSHNFGPSYPFGYNYKGQSSVLYSAPARAAPRWIPGHWGRQWVPQYYIYDAWVPGYYDSGGGWIEGYYEAQTVQSGGYYQQVWMDGYWAQ